jgi:hypothetical protein
MHVKSLGAVILHFQFHATSKMEKIPFALSAWLVSRVMIVQFVSHSVTIFVFLLCFVQLKNK